MVAEKEETKFGGFNVGEIYIRKVLPARKKRPPSIKYKDVPETESRYGFLLESATFYSRWPSRS